MVWFRVDDNLGFHHKVIAAGNPAMGLWVRAGAVCASQLTDGFVANHMVASLGTTAQAKKLVEVGLWDVAEGGYTFHEWDERQPTRRDVEAERAAAKDRMKAARERKRKAAQEASAQASESRSGDVRPNTSRSSGEVRDVFGDPYPTQPDPARPNPPREEQADKPPARKRAHQLPDDFTPNETNRRLAAERGLDLRGVFEQFADHHRARGTTMKDWHAAFNTWLRRERPGPTAAQQPQSNAQGWLRLASEMDAQDNVAPFRQIGGAS